LPDRHQSGTNSGCFVAYFYFALTRHAQVLTTRLQEYLLAALFQPYYPQLVSKLGHNTFAILSFTPDKTEWSCKTTFQLVQVITVQLKAVALSRFIPGGDQAPSQLDGKAFPEKPHTAFTQVFDFGGVFYWIQRTDYVQFN